MSESHRPARRLIVGRALAAGVLAGAGTGLVIGTATFPIVGTGLGTAIGGLAGAGIGLANGVLLAVVAAWTDRRGVFAAVAGVVCGVGGLIGVSLAAGGGSRGWPAPAFVAWCIGLGVVLGPVVAKPRQPSGRNRTSDADLTRILRFSAYGTAGAAAVGAVVGLAVGLAAYAPTAPFALIDDAFLAGPPGALLGALVGCLVVSGCPLRQAGWR